MVKYDSTNGYYLTRVCVGNESENAELHSVSFKTDKCNFRRFIEDSAVAKQCTISKPRVPVNSSWGKMEIL